MSDHRRPESEPRFGAILTESELTGPHAASDWGRWTRLGRTPGGTYRPLTAAQSAEDLGQLADLGAIEIALTLEWARLEPVAGRRDQQALEELQERFRLAKSLGLEPWGCVVDGTLPGWFVDDEHGFTDDDTRSSIWTRHLDWLQGQFGDLVEGWIPMREPHHHLIRNHLLGWGPPGGQNQNQTALEVKAAILAEGEAWRVLAGSAPVATYQTARLFVPIRTEAGAHDLAAVEHTRILDQLLTTSWSAALAEGEIGLDGFPARVEHLTDAFDRVIVQVRPPITVDGEGRWRPCDRGFLAEGSLSGFEQVADRVDRGRHPLVAAADVGPVPDDGTSQLDHLSGLIEGTSELGASAWWQASPIDGWQWERGYDTPAGIIDADRTPRMVADGLAGLARRS